MTKSFNVKFYESHVQTHHPMLPTLRYAYLDEVYLKLPSTIHHPFTLYILLYPPSTGSPIPVTQLASSLAKNTAALAISCGVPSPRNGCCASTAAFCA